VITIRTTDTLWSLSRPETKKHRRLENGRNLNRPSWRNTTCTIWGSTVWCWLS